MKSTLLCEAIGNIALCVRGQVGPHRQHEEEGKNLLAVKKNQGS